MGSRIASSIELQELESNKYESTVGLRRGFGPRSSARDAEIIGRATPSEYIEPLENTSVHELPVIRPHRELFHPSATVSNMVNEAFTFRVSTILVIVGLAISLYGVSLNSGQALNIPMIAGGVSILTGIGVLAAGIMRLEDNPNAE